MTKYIWLIFFCLLSEVATANEVKKYLYVLGGGGEPKKNSTIFDGELQHIANFAKKAKWEPRISFNGGHSKTEKIIKDHFPPGAVEGDFTEKTYKRMLSEIKDKLERGDFRPGDQLMLLLNTHGAMRMGSETTHSIALAHGSAENLDSLRGAQIVSMDTLIPIFNLAKNKGVKLAFADLSCHSGASLALPDSDACIISASGPNHYGYIGKFEMLGISLVSTFPSTFNKELAPGKNLEDIYLSSRKNKGEVDFPMISTPEGKAIQELLYKLVTPYLYYNSQETTKFDNMYTIENINDVSCKQEENFKGLMGIIGQLESMNQLSFSGAEFNQLKAALHQYREYQIKYEQSYKDLRSVSDDIKAILKKDYPQESKMFNESDGVSILNADYQRSIQMYTELHRKSASNYELTLWGDEIKKLNRKKQIVSEIRTKLTPGSLQKIEGQKKMFETSGVTFGLAMKVANQLKGLYLSLYKANKKETSNPCREFIL
jgi:hypothetical protein